MFLFGFTSGFISGAYDQRNFIDLRPLAQFAKARIIQADIENIDLNDKKLILPNRPNISFDLLSINIGSEPNLSMIPGAQDHAIGIKPTRFLELWPQLLQRTISTLTQKNNLSLLL